MTPELKPCPCGETPEYLLVRHSPLALHYLASGECCSTWEVEFDGCWKPFASDDLMALASAAWNDAVRQQSEMEKALAEKKRQIAELWEKQMDIKYAVLALNKPPITQNTRKQLNSLLKVTNDTADALMEAIVVQVVQRQG